MSLSLSNLTFSHSTINLNSPPSSHPPVMMGYFSSCNADSAIPTHDSFAHKKHSSKIRHQEQDAITQFSYSELQMATNNFSTEMFLGKGSHGWVYKAILHGGKLAAAVKKTKGYKISNSSCVMSLAENEIEILSRVKNPGLVNLIGFCVDSAGEKLTVVEYMPNGTLYELLHTSSGSNIDKRLGWRKRVRFALEIARAIDSLHSVDPPVIHRDIKSSNILLDKKMRARLGDFGLALRGHVEDVRVKCTPPAGTMGYLDPSYLAPQDLSTKSDVFSFGILLLEIISGRNAIDVDYSPPSIIDWAIPLIKIGDFQSICDCRIGPPADISTTRQLAILASRCVAVEAKGRPEMGEVVKCLKEIRKRLGTSHSSPWRSNFTSCLRKSVKQESEYLPGSGTGRQLVVSDSDDNNQEVQETTVVEDLNVRYRGNKTGAVFGLELTSKSKRTDTHIERMSRWRSIGSVDEITRQLAIGKKQESLSVIKIRAVRLNKSRSVGVLRSRSLIRDQTDDQERALLISDQQQQHAWPMDDINETCSVAIS